MSLSIGIVGLPNVGKSTLFNALTDNEALAANYPFATIEPNVGIVPVPDERLPILQKMYNSKKLIPATVSFIDIAGLVGGASKGEGLGNKFLANIRECSAICHVVRHFEDSSVQHIDNHVDPKNDIETINTELILADLQTVDQRIARLNKEAKADKKALDTIAYIEELKDNLEKGIPLHQLPTLDLEKVKDLHLLTAKPIIYVFNVDEATIADRSEQQKLSQLTTSNQAIFISAKLEDELRGLSREEAKEYLAGFGQSQSGLEQLAKCAYDALRLQSFLTAGPDEVHAWTIKKDTLAPQAAGVIHTDFEKGFIAAQIISYSDLISAGSEVAAKAAGKVRLEGRTYIMKPDDIVEFRFNV